MAPSDGRIRSNPHIRSVHPLAVDAAAPIESPKQVRSPPRSARSDSSESSNESEPRIADDDPDGIDIAIKPELQEMPAWKKFLFSKWGCAILLSTLTILILLFIRPAFFLKRRENTLDRPRIHWLYVFVTWIILFFLIVMIPWLVTVCKKKWVGTKG